MTSNMSRIVVLTGSPLLWFNFATGFPVFLCVVSAYQRMSACCSQNRLNREPDAALGECSGIMRLSEV